jgi:hypothetical protein
MPIVATHDFVLALLLPPLAPLPPLLPQPAATSAPSAVAAMITLPFMDSASILMTRRRLKYAPARRISRLIKPLRCAVVQES